ncbi:capsular polysaccharide biosynthesis protein-like protein [Nostoc sp. NIES-4103]|nr:capsular polysaccharide biosynthesis protein-like protein [Nostoc sp. NIES-4103]
MINRRQLLQSQDSNYIRYMASKLSRKLKYLVKRYILSKPLPRGYIPLSIDNADTYFGDDKDIKIYKFVHDEGTHGQEAKFLEGDFLKVWTNFKSEFESVVIDTTKQGFIFWRGFTIDPNLNVIYEKNLELNEIPIYLRELVNCQKLEGTVAYLSNGVPQNYGHWLLYAIPQLDIYWKFINKQEIDYYYIGDSIANFQKETLLALGIKEEQIVHYPCQADRLITCVINRKVQKESHTYPSIFAYRFSRNIFLPKENYSNSKYPKRLYVKRGKVNHREVINDNEVIEYLESIGFEALEMQGRTMQEQAEIFYNADVIISVTGSGLTNLLFIRESTTVIEIVPFSFRDGFFYALGSYSQANYFYMLGEKVPGDTTKPQRSNIKVNINKLKQICKLANLV